MKKLLTLLLAGAVFATPSFAGVDVHVGIPAPQIVIEAPPHLVVVPGTPVVRYAPDVDYNYFTYGGRYYTTRDDRWYSSSAYGGRTDAFRLTPILPKLMGRSNTVF